MQDRDCSCTTFYTDSSVSKVKVSKLFSFKKWNKSIKILTLIKVIKNGNFFVNIFYQKQDDKRAREHIIMNHFQHENCLERAVKIEFAMVLTIGFLKNWYRVFFNKTTSTRYLYQLCFKFTALYLVISSPSSALRTGF